MCRKRCIASSNAISRSASWRKPARPPRCSATTSRAATGIRIATRCWSKPRSNRSSRRTDPAACSDRPMLQRLSIRNVVLIDRLDLTFESGLSVLTGETGAGKSILLDALGLALGHRAESGLLRAGSDAATVSAEFALPRDHEIFSLLAEQALPVEPV